jgi:hypothetical protein
MMAPDDIEAGLELAGQCVRPPAVDIRRLVTS